MPLPFDPLKGITTIEVAVGMSAIAISLSPVVSRLDLD